MGDFGIEISGAAMGTVGLVCVLYVLVITMFGGYFARFNSNINDFFYSGQRFSWWLPAASMIATGIGSYSYLKYSEQGYNTGMSSSLTYMNDWFIVPFFMFGWLPIVYFAKVKSIPEYFERRFNKLARYIAVTIIMCYMFFYIGYNLYTIGVAIEGMFGFPLMYTVPLVGTFLGLYVTYGGQTAVIFTDLFQGVMLYIAGGIAIFAGIYALGGMGEFWSWLPVSHRLPFVHLTDNPKFNTAGLYWGEALAGSIAFTFMNQGFIMRYLTIKSVNEGRKAVLFNVLITLPISAIIVGAVGWIAKALMTKQAAMGGPLAGLNLIEIENTFHTFIIVCWETVYQNPWVFGFVIAALMAALMSTIDTLINACAAICIYDLYRPFRRGEIFSSFSGRSKATGEDTDSDSKHYLKAARYASMICTAIGLLLVIWFNGQKGSLMSIHYKGIMIIIPAIVTTIFLGAFWSRFNAKAACWSMIGGSICTVITVLKPELIDPLSAFVLGPQNGIYIYMRALFGMVITAVIGVTVTYFTAPADKAHSEGLTADTLDVAMQNYKGGTKPNHAVGEKVEGLGVKIDESIPKGKVGLGAETMKRLKANDEDLLYITDSRWWLGGLRSDHVNAKLSLGQDEQLISMSKETFEKAYMLEGKPVTAEKIF
jgi:SSS family solute:Na+ symporter